MLAPKKKNLHRITTHKDPRFRRCIEVWEKDGRRVLNGSMHHAEIHQKKISSYIKIHLRESKDVRHINTVMNICHTHFLSQKNSG